MSLTQVSKIVISFSDQKSPTLQHLQSPPQLPQHHQQSQSQCLKTTSLWFQFTKRTSRSSMSLQRQLGFAEIWKMQTESKKLEEPF